MEVLEETLESETIVIHNVRTEGKGLGSRDQANRVAIVTIVVVRRVDVVAVEVQVVRVVRIVRRR